MIPAHITTEMLNERRHDTILAHLDIRFTSVGSNFIEATMPVDHRTRQPYGILHGGASVTLAETLGSMGSTLCVDPQNYRVAGLEINANHVRSVSDGYVTGRAEIIHEGRSTHIWDIRIKDPSGKLVCISRITVAVLELKGK
jgi:1,4-dihydroxy-2-naphthoyl-CoA hydrolase